MAVPMEVRLCEMNYIKVNYTFSFSQRMTPAVEISFLMKFEVRGWTITSLVVCEIKKIVITLES